jgi:hypothetical protein
MQKQRILRMPKKTTKGARKEADAPTAQSGDDFDDMLAEARALIVAIAAASSNSSSSRSGSRDASNATRPEMAVSDETIIDACKRGNVIQLQRWGRQGVRVTGADPLYQAVGNRASIDVLCCLVNELGANVNGETPDSTTPLCAAGQ